MTGQPLRWAHHDPPVSSPEDGDAGHTGAPRLEAEASPGGDRSGAHRRPWAVLAWSPIAAVAVGAVKPSLLGWQALVTRERWIAVAFGVAVVSMIALLFILAAVDIQRVPRRANRHHLQQLPGDGPVGY